MSDSLRLKITQYTINRFRDISENNNNKISLIDFWNVQFEIERKFNITDHQSQEITAEILEVM